MATYKEVKNILEKYDLTEEEFEKIFDIVLKINWKLQRIMESDDNMHWSDLPHYHIEAVIRQYYSSDILEQITVEISMQELFSLKKAELKLQSLAVGGVDNWEWYGESLSEFDEAVEILREKMLREHLEKENNKDE